MKKIGDTKKNIISENIFYYFEISFYKDNRLIFMLDKENANFLTKVIILQKEFSHYYDV